MRSKRRAQLQKSVRIRLAEKPTTLTLITRIVESAFTGGMLLILAFGSMIITFMYYNHFSTENLLVLLIGTVIVSAFCRGCLAWQHDLNEYQRYKSEMRHTQKMKESH
jgi:predicted lipid-binding transport protein (Tim44 family)